MPEGKTLLRKQSGLHQDLGLDLSHRQVQG